MSPPKISCLVVGADSLIGANLLTLLKRIGNKVTGTTRRTDRLHVKDFLQLDLNEVNTQDFKLQEYSIAFICTAITNMTACEDDPVHTHQINVTNTVNLTRDLLTKGTRVVFLSSNAVFNGVRTWPDEGAHYSPICEYGRQKMKAEQQLLSLPNSAASVAIVRLSKVISPQTGMTAEFIRHLNAGECCPAFVDLRMCPISLGYATEALWVVAQSSKSGIFHLAGEQEMSYASFACHLATHLGADPALVHQITSTKASTQVLFKPPHPGLGMTRTRELLGIEPEPVTLLMKTIPRI